MHAVAPRMRALTRRAFAGSALAALALPAIAVGTRNASALTDLRGALDASETGLRAGAEDDQSATFRAALARAASAGRPLFLPPGRYTVAGITLPSRTHLIGVPGESRLVFGGGDFMLRAAHAQRLRLEGVVLDGGARPLSAPALLDADDVADLAVDDCDVVASGAAGVHLRATSGRVERSRFADMGTVGIYLRQATAMTVRDNSVADCGDTGILVARDSESADNSLVIGNRVSRIRADSGGTGQNGNGINLDKANGVVVADNRIDDCAFSAIRCFSSDNVAVTGNIATRSGEMAFYVEFAFEGAIVANNLIDGGNGGISFANFMEHGGRLGTCTGNIVRNITGGPRYADGNAQIGAGISAEADMAITGNVVENAVWGLKLGWGPYLRDITATGNVVRRARIGIAISAVEGGGPALIANNVLSEIAEGAILGMRWEDVATEDLVGGSDALPGIAISGNRRA